MTAFEVGDAALLHAITEPVDQPHKDRKNAERHQVRRNELAHLTHSHAMRAIWSDFGHSIGPVPWFAFTLARFSEKIVITHHKES